MSVLTSYPLAFPEGSTLTGLGREVREKLETVSDESVVAVVLPKGSGASAGAIARTFENIAQLVPALIDQDLIRSAPQRVADAALDELEGVAHG